MGLNADPPRASKGYAFGPFILDPVRRVLYHGADVVPITAKTFDVLLILVANRERLVTKDELLKAAWPDVVVQENNLVRQISTLRRLLHERPDAHEFVVTITGQGYRFVAPVEEVDVPTNGHGADVQAAGTRPPGLPAEMAPDAAHPPAEPPALAAVGTNWLILSLLAVVVGAGVLGIVYTSGVSIDGWRVHPLTQVTYDPTLPRSPTWAPDGQAFAYVSDQAGSPDIWKQRLDDPSPIQLTTHAAIDSEPDWSPDGQQIVFRSERDGGGLYLMSADGGLARRISEFGCRPRWSPDGSQILFKRSATATGGSPNYYVLNLGDGTPAEPLRPDVLRTFASAYAAWRPDGRVSLWGRRRDGGRQFVSIDVESGKVAVASMTDGVADALEALSPGKFLWARTGRFILFEAESGSTGDIWKVAVDPDGDRWVRGPERLTTGAGTDTGMALSRDGTRLLYGDYAVRARLWAFPFDTAASRIEGEPVPVTSGGIGEIDADVPRDGSKVVYRAERAGRHELWERTIADGSERLLLSSGEWRHSTPRWSPDGTRVAYSRFSIDSMRAVDVAMLPAGGGNERALTRPGEMEFLPWDWMPDASALIGACRLDAMQRFGTCLMAVPPSGQVSRSAVEVIASDPALDLFNQELSPDQQWISFMAIDPDRTEVTTVYAVPVGGGAWIPMTDGTAFDDKPTWSADGRTLIFVSDRSGMLNVWGRRWNVALGQPAGDPFVVTDFQSPRFRLNPKTASMDIELTSTDLLLPISEATGQVWMLDGVDQ